MPILDRMVLMPHLQLPLLMPLGKSRHIHKVHPMGKVVPNQAIQLILPMQHPIQLSIHMQLGIIIKLKHLKDRAINIIIQLILQQPLRMLLLIKLQPLTSISLPIRLHRPITIVNEKKKKGNTSEHHVQFVFPPFFFF